VAIESTDRTPWRRSPGPSPRSACRIDAAEHPGRRDSSDRPWPFPRPAAFPLYAMPSAATIRRGSRFGRLTTAAGSSSSSRHASTRAKRRRSASSGPPAKASWSITGFAATTTSSTACSAPRNCASARTRSRSSGSAAPIRHPNRHRPMELCYERSRPRHPTTGRATEDRIRESGSSCVAAWGQSTFGLPFISVRPTKPGLQGWSS
jgi:hypothetical protein